MADRVKNLYVEQQSAVLAREAGEAALKEWQADAAKAQGLSPAIVVSREQTHGQPVSVVNAALQAKTDVLPSWSGVSLGDEGYAVVKLEKVLPSEERNAQIARRHCCSMYNCLLLQKALPTTNCSRRNSTFSLRWIALEAKNL